MLRLLSAWPSTEIKMHAFFWATCPNFSVWFIPPAHVRKWLSRPRKRKWVGWSDTWSGKGWRRRRRREKKRGEKKRIAFDWMRITVREWEEWRREKGVTWRKKHLIGSTIDDVAAIDCFSHSNSHCRCRFFSSSPSPLCAYKSRKRHVHC